MKRILSLLLLLAALPLLAGCRARNADASQTDYRSLAAASIAVEQPGLAPAPKPPAGKCTNCNGTGYVGDGTVRVKCVPCDGKGVITEQPFVPMPISPTILPPAPVVQPATKPVAPVAQVTAPPRPGPRTPCVHCRGTGTVAGHRCPRCNGRGWNDPPPPNVKAAPTQQQMVTVGGSCASGTCTIQGCSPGSASCSTGSCGPMGCGVAQQRTSTGQRTGTTYTSYGTNYGTSQSYSSGRRLFGGRLFGRR